MLSESPAARQALSDSWQKQPSRGAPSTTQHALVPETRLGGTCAEKNLTIRACCQVVVLTGTMLSVSSRMAHELGALDTRRLRTPCHAGATFGRQTAVCGARACYFEYCACKPFRTTTLEIQYIRHQQICGASQYLSPLTKTDLRFSRKTLFASQTRQRKCLILIQKNLGSVREQRVVCKLVVTAPTSKQQAKKKKF